LAIVRVASGLAQQPVYVRRFFDREVTFVETAVVFDVERLIALGRSQSPEVGV
jgi:hypothetical protein